MPSILSTTSAPSWAAALMSVAPLVSALGPIAIILAAWWAWRKQRRIAADRATIDFISRLEVGNREWKDAMSLFFDLTSHPDHPTPLNKLLDPANPEEWERRLAIHSALSHFDAVAVAVRHKTINEAMYRDWNRETYVRVWQRAKAYITAREQRGGLALYPNFQKLARRWNDQDNS